MSPLQPIWSFLEQPLPKYVLFQFMTMQSRLLKSNGVIHKYFVIVKDAIVQPEIVFYSSK